MSARSQGQRRPSAAQLAALRRADPELARWMRVLPAFPGFPDRRNPRQASHYQALSSAIVYQQLSGKAAQTIWGRVAELGPGGRFPDAAALLRIDPRRLRGAGLSRAKVAALLDLAQRIEDGRLPL